MRGRTCRLTLPYRYHEWSCGSYPSSACPCSVFSGHFFCMFCCCFSFSFLSFVFHEAANIYSSRNMITAVFPVVFTSSFGIKTPNQMFEGYMYKVNRRKRVYRSFGRRKHVARHRNYRVVLSLRSRYRQKTKNRLHRRKITAIFGFYRLRQSRYRQKTKNRLPLKKYRHILVLPPPPKPLPPKNEKPPTTKKLPPYCMTAGTFNMPTSYQ